VKATRVVVGKGRTSRPSEEEEWIREYYEVEVEVDSEKELSAAREWALNLIDGWLQGAVAMPQFDPSDLMEHEWKGSRKSGGEYAKGSLSWGWDFKDNFKPETIRVLEKGPLTIDQYEFSLTNKIVQTRKVKK